MAQQLCPKCREPVCKETLAATAQARKKFQLGVNSDCRECNLNYKAENRKHNSDSARRAAWDSRSEEQRVEWYRSKKARTAPLHEAEQKQKKRRVETITKTRR